MADKERQNRELGDYQKIVDQAFKDVLATPEGRIVMLNLLSPLDTVSFHTDLAYMAFNEGKRDNAITLKHKICAIDPVIYIQMQQEYLAHTMTKGKDNE